MRDKLDEIAEDAARSGEFAGGKILKPLLRSALQQAYDLGREEEREALRVIVEQTARRFPMAGVEIRQILAALDARSKP